jgi:His-Xaa-Ser system protein HxsD
MKKESRLVVDNEVYSEEALRLASYVFEDRFRTSISRKGAVTELSFSGGAGDPAGEFLNEALNQQCRLDLMKKNSGIARLVVTRMLISATGEKEAKRGAS